MPHDSHTFPAAPLRRALFCFASLSTLFTARVDAQTTIAAGTGNYAATTAGSYTLNSGATRSVTSGSTEVITLGAASGTFNLTIDGTVSQAGTGRGIRTTSSGTPVFNITVSSTGVVKAVSDDAIQGRVGTVNLTNLGTLYSGPNLALTPSTVANAGRGLNLRDAAGGTVVNGSTTNSTALIRSDGGDAVRVGSNFAVTNYGTIAAYGVVNDASSNNAFNSAPLSTSTATTYSAGGGFSFEDIDATHGATNSSLDNYGTITGARHGVQAGAAGSSLTVTNRADGQIIGRNGSGVGFDTTTSDATKIVVNNYGLIRGDYAGGGNIIDRTGNASPTNDGDGDGVDIDGAATIHNYATGQILATGAGGYDSGGRANTSDAISIGGGVIVNDGTIRGATYGVIVNNDAVASRSGVAATSITNNADATIEGQAGFAIRLENKLGTAADDDTIVNAGTIIGNGSIPDGAATVTLQNGATDTNSTGTLDGVTYTGTGSARFIRGDGAAIQMGEGNDTLTNTGTITGNTGRAINMEGGNDTVNFSAGTITGSINGGAGTDTLNLGAGVSTASAIQNFEAFGVASGRATLSGVVNGSALTKSGAGTLVLAGANTYAGGTTVAAGTLLVNNASGSGAGAGDVTLDAGATFGGTGSIAGGLIASGVVAPGDGGVGTLTVGGNVAWNGTSGNAWLFELGLAGVSDLLVTGGDFLKGTGGSFLFDFAGTGASGTYVLVDWAGGTTFAAGDFSFANLAAGYTGAFALNGSQLEFTATAVPEPATTAAWLAGVAVAGAVWWKRRRTA